MKIGFLSVLQDPLLGSMLRAFVRSGISPSAVLLDEKDVSPKNLKIFMERTEKRFPEVSLFEVRDVDIPYYFVPNNNCET